MSPLVKKLAWGLALSVSLNLFLLGFGVARHLRPHAPPAMMAEGRELDHAHATRWFGPHSAAMRTQRMEVQKARSSVVNALTAEPFQRETLESAFAALREVTSDGQKKLHDVLVETAANASHEERVLLAKSRLLHDSKPSRKPRL